jgi:polysaccharide pyruvyl transferase WcaK-like protein
MRLGFIGYYNHSNYGDDRILYCTLRHFTDHNKYIVEGWRYPEKELEEINKCDYVLIGGNTFSLKDINFETEMLKKIKPPFSFIGMTLQTENKKMNAYFDVLKEKADLILVRDNESKSILNNHYKVVVGPDLSFLYPLEIIPESTEDICGVNLRDWGNPEGIFGKLHYDSLRTIYSSLKLDSEKIVKIIKENFENTSPIPFNFDKIANNDIDILSNFFDNVPLIFDIDLYKNIRYLIGMRYHSIAFAIQCGIPFIHLYYQPKTASIYSDMGFPELLVSIHKTEELVGKINYIKNNYQTVREKLISKRADFNREIKYILNSVSSLLK